MLADAVSLVAFACVGLLSHGHAPTPAALARDALPLLGGWFTAATALRAYRRPTARRLLATWALGVPLGVLARALVLGRDLDGRQVAFLLTTLALTLVFVASGRALLRLASRRA